jgi:hypothetical protein
MLYESQFWKEDLTKIAKRLKKRSRTPSSDEMAFVKTEKDIFIGFYMVRKLAESQKITDASANLEIDAISYPRLDERVDRINRSNWEELYDLENGQNIKVKIDFLYNQIIHSFIFSQIFEDENDTLVSIFVTSDRKRNTCIYEIKIQELIRLFTAVGLDEVSMVTFERDGITNEIRIKQVL